MNSEGEADTSSDDTTGQIKGEAEVEDGGAAGAEEIEWSLVDCDKLEADAILASPGSKAAAPPVQSP
jgi:hypothetical protein